MAFYTYDHIHLLSPEPLETARYFNEMFGARIVESVQSDGNPRVDLDLNGLEIFIARCAEDTTPSADHPHRGLDHFGLRVENLDAAAAELKAKGADFTSEPREIRPGVRIAFVVAPGNIRIELLEKDPNAWDRSRRALRWTSAFCRPIAGLEWKCAVGSSPWSKAYRNFIDRDWKWKNVSGRWKIFHKSPPL